MDKLNFQLNRLFGLPGPGKHAATDVQDSCRRLCLAIRRPADWEHAATLLRGVQEDMELPAPLVSVDGRGFRLWFPLAEPVSREHGIAFLTQLIARYASELPVDRIQAEAADTIELPPARLGDDERWSAFIDPSMGSMFIDEPWLGMVPTPDKQADLLAGFERIERVAFEGALGRLASPQTQAAGGDTPPPESAAVAHGKLHLSGPHADPQSFLLAVMNDPNASPALRVDAAKALLPYVLPAKQPTA